MFHKEYLEKEIHPFEPNAWIDKKKTKVGYEIPMIRYFYEFPTFPSRDELLSEMQEAESKIQAALTKLYEE